MFKYTKLSTGIALASLVITSQTVNAAGFALNDHSATASGNALAGVAASNEDISTSFWNPANLANTDKPTLYISGALVIPDMKVTVNSATDATGNDLTGASSPGDIVDTTLVPSIVYAHPISKKTVLGASLNVPFGLSGEYGPNWAGRYHSSKSEVSDIAFAFSVAHKYSDKLSVGASVQLHSAEVILDSALTDFQGGNSAKGDGFGNIQADDLAVGYALGIKFEPQKGTRIGIGYRSEIDFSFEGDVKYNNVNSTLLSKGIDNAYVFDEISFPDVLSFGFEQDINDKLTLGASAIRTGWGTMDGLDIAFDLGDDNVKQPNSVLTFGFEDQWLYSIGATYKASKKLTLRTGYAVDNSPITDQYRSARTPDGDRTWISLGASYQVNQEMTLTAAYTNVSIDDVKVNRNGAPEDSVRGRLDADYETSADVFSVGMNMTF
ncbi:outer membrane protein transport protein [Marinomonas sp. 15G1-11]|uniref:Outer membrane protein transport protein n=1 Tax=Marinomonas phaeophyticola TaxID=3004091 RepID=A0ABT4JVQ1_9GAMM|nr:outer membrane protein transport protein [Marinomonas sp. 15G1-11]MCZ2722325.1 outer membrane protein transport protein [Marinomonas sp. 15G1-11]